MRSNELFDEGIGSLIRFNNRPIVLENQGSEMLLMNLTEHDRGGRIKRCIIIDHNAVGFTKLFGIGAILKQHGHNS